MYLKVSPEGIPQRGATVVRSATQVEGIQNDGASWEKRFRESIHEMHVCER